MKRNLTITKLMIALIGLTLTSCSTWHYQHSRVSVEREKTTTVTIEPTSAVSMITSPTDKVIENGKVELNTINNSTIDKNKSENISLAKTDTKKSPVVTKTPVKSFIDHFIKKQNNDLHKVKKVEKEAFSGWVRIMIILFVVGFLLILIGIFLSVFIFGGFWWLFYTFGALLIIAGFIVLILGLLGLI